MFEKVTELLERKDVEEKIITSLKTTKETRKEHAFEFFYSNGEITTGDIKEGKKGGVLPDNINRKHVIGSFHTHPKLISGDIYPSMEDIGKCIWTMDFFCVGGNKKRLGVIRCFDGEDLLTEFMNILKGNEWFNKKGEKVEFGIIEKMAEIRKKQFEKIEGLEFPKEFEQKEFELPKEIEKCMIILARLVDRMLKDNDYLDRHSYKKTYMLR